MPFLGPAKLMLGVCIIDATVWVNSTSAIEPVRTTCNPKGAIASATVANCSGCQRRSLVLARKAGTVHNISPSPASDRTSTIFSRDFVSNKPFPCSFNRCSLNRTKRY